MENELMIVPSRLVQETEQPTLHRILDAGDMLCSSLLEAISILSTCRDEEDAHTVSANLAEYMQAYNQRVIQALREEVR